MLLNNSHLIYYIFLIKKNKVVKLEEMCQFCIGHHVGDNLDVPRQKQEFFLIHLSCPLMDGNRKWFGHHRNGDKKKSVSQIVATENQDCDD
jgi:hypothetical protein